MTPNKALGVIEMETLLSTAGLFMLAHIALTFVLRAAIGRDRALSQQLFVRPYGARPFPDWVTFPMLRARYFLPWRHYPPDMSIQSPLVILLFLFTGISGAAVPLLLLSFLGLGVYQALT